MPNRFFSPGGRKCLRGRLRPPFPLITDLCPIVLKYVQHIFPGGPKIFLASCQPGFAPLFCVDGLATVEALKMNVHLLLLWLATLQIGATVCECLRKRHNWRVSRSSEFGLLAQGLWERGPTGTLFRGPTATEGPETGQARNQLETPRGRRVFWEGSNFLAHSE